MRSWHIPPSGWDGLSSTDQVIMMAYEQWRYDALHEQLKRFEKQDANTPDAVATLISEMI